MPTFEDAEGVISYEDQGSAGSPVLLVTGLGGIGKAWGPQIGLFSRAHRVIVPDHPGTGGSSAPRDGYTIAQHAERMAALVRRLDVGPVHVVGSSTGGAIAQLLALDHPDVVKTATIASSWARVDDFFRREFDLRKRLLLDSGLRAAQTANVLFLFSPRFIREHPERIQAWVDAGQNGGTPRDVMIRRIDMILAHDALDRLPQIRRPVLVVVGASDFCTPSYFAEELAGAIPDAELRVLQGGHFVYLEDPDGFHDTVAGFIAPHDAA